MHLMEYYSMNALQAKVEFWVIKVPFSLEKAAGELSDYAVGLGIKAGALEVTSLWGQVTVSLLSQWELSTPCFAEIN